MTDANKRANVASEIARADESMRAARVLFLDRGRGTIAGFLGSKS